MAHIMDAPWEYDIKPFRITDNVWYVGTAQVGSHLIDTRDGLVLLDTGWPNTLYLLLESIRQAGFDPADIRYIIHSHYHIDHIGGTDRMMKKYGCRSVLGVGDLPLTAERIDLSLCSWHDSMWVTGFPITDPVADGDTLTVGDTTFSFVALPGHTPGTLGIFFDTAWQGKPVRAGMHGGVGRNTLASSFIRQYHLDASVRVTYRQSLLRARRERVDVALGNHPAQISVLERLAAAPENVNPFIDDTIWPAFIDKLLAAYDDMLAKDPLED